MKILYKIEIFGWEKYNKKSKPNMQSIMVSKRFFDDAKIQVLPPSGKLLYLFLLLRRGDVDTTSFVCSHEDCVTSAGGRGVLVSRLLDQLQSFQLLTYEKITPNRIEKNRIESNRSENNFSDPEKFIQEPIEKTLLQNPKEKKIKNWFEMFVVEEMGSLDTGLIILSPKVEKCFGGEPGFREWISGLTSAKKFKEISAEEQLRYFKKSLTDEMKLRGVL